MEPRPAEAGCLLLCSGEGWRQVAAAYEEQSWPSPAPWVELWCFSLTPFTTAIGFSEEFKPSRKYFFLFGRKPTLPIWTPLPRWIFVGQPQQPDLPIQGPGLGLRSGVGNRAAGGGWGRGFGELLGKGWGRGLGKGWVGWGLEEGDLGIYWGRMGGRIG